MKKILFAIAIVIMMTVGANAQADHFFSESGNAFWGEDRSVGGLPQIPYDDNIGALSGDIPAQVPVGSGLLVLAALGGAYAITRRKQ